MNRSDQGSTQSGAAPCPPVVLDWIAWYPEGELPDGVRGTIDAHAAQCSDCREEIARMQASEAITLEDVPDAERVFARVQERIRASESEPIAVAPARRPPLHRPRPMWVATRRVAMAATVALTIGAGLVGAGISTLLQGGSETYYESVSEPEATPVGEAAATVPIVMLDVVFRPEVAFGRVHEVLNEVGATIASGPTRLGVMRLHLPSGSDAQAIATQLRGGGEGVALFAETVVP
jgi:hypothetical protein